MKFSIHLVVVTHIFFLSSLGAQSPDKLGAFCDKNEYALMSEYFEFLKLPNTFNDRQMLDVNANFILGMLKKAGIQGRLMYDKNKKSVPAVYGEYIHSPQATTIIFYAHYDGQPVNPANWHQGLDPFKPQLVSDRLDRGGKFMAFPKKGEKFDPKWRIYGRASADDKAGVYSIIKAFQAIKDMGLKPNINIKFFFEGEEENGSVNLEDILEHNKEALKSDLWVICDGPMPATGQKQITYGVRGDVNMHLTVYGPKRPLHSGNYGNWAPNPAQKLIRLLSSMKDENGLVLIDGYYDDVIPLSAAEKKALSEIEDPAPVLKQELGFAEAEMLGVTFLESITSIPTLNINGISAANTGRLASNVIPTTASAALDLRLVKGNTVENQVKRVKDHIRKMGFYIVDKEPTDEERAKYKDIIFVTQGHGYPAQRTPIDHPLAMKVASAVQSSTDKKIILMPSAGGSLPLYLFDKVTKTYPVTIPVVNYDNNQHAENENLELGRLKEGIKTIGAVMLGL
ncbi:MAG: M20/M25/M40 family metallo-hydrolase [Saprospiraceae bacterium]|nr:M20/M25/M40 family metallo-hydrolase [Saprospiraceae bacterium]